MRPAAVVPRCDWWGLSTRIPSGYDAAAAQRRQELCSRVSRTNGAEGLSLAEIDMVLDGLLGPQAAKLLASTAALQRAFAKVKLRPSPHVGADRLDANSEFRAFLLHVRWHLELFGIFQSAGWVEDGRRVSLAEWCAAAAGLERWGARMGSAEAVRAGFFEVDWNGSGLVPIEECCTWAVERRLDHDLDGVYLPQMDQPPPTDHRPSRHLQNPAAPPMPPHSPHPPPPPPPTAAAAAHARPAAVQMPPPAPASARRSLARPPPAPTPCATSAHRATVGRANVSSRLWHTCV